MPSGAWTAPARSFSAEGRSCVASSRCPSPASPAPPGVRGSPLHLRSRKKSRQAAGRPAGWNPPNPKSRVREAPLPVQHGASIWERKKRESVPELRGRSEFAPPESTVWIHELLDWIDEHRLLDSIDSSKLGIALEHSSVKFGVDRK